MPCEAQENCGGRTRSCPQRTTAAASEAARVGAAGRGAAAALCSAMRRVARCEGVDGNAHTRAEGCGMWSSAGSSCAIGCPCQ